MTSKTKEIFIGVLLVMTASLFVNCAFGETQSSMQPELLSMTSKRSDRMLTVQAPKPIWETDEIYSAAYERDEATLDVMLEELLAKEYPSIEKVGNYDWMGFMEDKLQATFGCTTLWSTYYTNIPKDMNGVLQEEAHLYDSYYKTSNQPAMCMLTPGDAEKIGIEFLAKWSHDLNFFVNRILSVIDEDRGCYLVNARAEFQGRPIITLVKEYSISPEVLFHISDEGIFSMQGLFLLKMQSKEPVNVVAVKDVMEHLGTAFSAYSELHDIYIDQVTLDYCMSTEDNIHFLVRPVWCFEGTGKNASDGLVSGITYVYYADDGKFNGAYLH